MIQEYFHGVCLLRYVDMNNSSNDDMKLYRNNHNIHENSNIIYFRSYNFHHGIFQTRIELRISSKIINKSIQTGRKNSIRF
jgi:hypothetical protein